MVLCIVAIANYLFLPFRGRSPVFLVCKMEATMKTQYNGMLIGFLAESVSAVGWFTSPLLQDPFILCNKRVNDFLHCQIGNKLVLLQVCPCYWIKVSNSLRMKQTASVVN